MPEQPADLATIDAGLDALEETGRAKKPDPVLRVVAPFLFLLFVVAVWQVLVWVEVKETYALPSPADTWREFTGLWTDGAITGAIRTSVWRGGLGFVAAVFLGTGLGLLLARVKIVRYGLGPFVSALQILPSVAWVPAGIIWFGLSNSAIYFVVLMGAVPSIANGLVAGIDQIPPLYLRVGRVLGARGIAAQRHVLIPAALPGYVAGLKQGWAFSWRSLMAAEIITLSPALGFGLGQLLNQGREVTSMAQVIVAIVTILFVGLAIELAVFAPVERRVLGRRGLALG